MSPAGSSRCLCGERKCGSEPPACLQVRSRPGDVVPLRHGPEVEIPHHGLVPPTRRAAIDAEESHELTTRSDGATTDVAMWPALVTVLALGSLPYASLVAANVGEPLDLGLILIWWVVTLSAGLAVVAIAGRGGRRTARWAGALVGVATYLFFNYPAITGIRELVGPPLVDLAWWALFSAVVLTIAVPLTRRSAVQRFLAYVAAGLLVLPMVEAATTSLAAAEPGVPTRAGSTIALTHTPNVYWFVLDSQAGPPFLREEIGMDPDPFLDHLRGRGFDVQERASSNYPMTHLSLSAALDMRYVYEGLGEPIPGPYHQRLQGHNLTVDTFLANDYRYVHAYPGLWTASRCSGREHLCLGDHGPIDETRWALAVATPLIELLADPETGEAIARTNDPLNVTDRMLSSAPARPYFAQIHLLNPHPPYFRDAQCGFRDVPIQLTAWGGGPEYEAAVTCLFDRLQTAIDRILAVDEDPVIIIQGDHGPRLGVNPSTSGMVLLGEEMHFSVLSAIRLPRRCEGLRIPEDLTLVNTFRIVFACLQDEPPDLLPDRHFPILREYG